MPTARRQLPLLSWPIRSGPDLPEEIDRLTTISFSTEDIPEADRARMWRDHYGQIALKVDIEPAPGSAFQACVLSRILPGLHLLSGTLSPARIERTRDSVADGNDDLALIINRCGDVTVSSRHRDLQLSKGDAVLVSGSDATVFNRWTQGESLSLRVPRRVLQSLIGDVDDAVMHQIPSQSEPLKLLTGYAHALIAENGLATPDLRHVAISHVQDLLALVLGGERGAARLGGSEGLRAARLRSAKEFVVRNSARHDIGVGTVAAHLGVTTRYLQRLFEADGSTFSALLLDQRLTNACRMLCDLQFADLPVSAIAYEVGFSDLSYFNRCFRRRYNATPTDVREARAPS
jgi:AraC-like DNA-binding protein